MTELEELSIHNTEISGTLPDSLYDLRNIRHLNLMDNAPGFDGTIKTEIGNLVMLEQLKLNNNPLLSGTLPSEIGMCEKLEQLLIQGTRIQGSVPDEICSLRDKNLHEHHNKYTSYFGSLPPIFAADCSPEISPHFNCTCCTTCCHHETNHCVDNIEI